MELRKNLAGSQRRHGGRGAGEGGGDNNSKRKRAKKQGEGEGEENPINLGGWG